MLQKYMVLTDDATVKIARKSRHVLHALCCQEILALSDNHGKNHNLFTNAYTYDGEMAALLLLHQEYDAQRELAFWARDRHYYHVLQKRSMQRCYSQHSHHVKPDHFSHCHYYQYARMGAFRDVGLDSSTNAKKGEEHSSLPFIRMWKAVKHRFEHAYDLIKEGPTSPADGMDQYIGNSNKKQLRKDQGRGADGIKSTVEKIGEMKHDRSTLYVNVVVKNSVNLVNNELKRMARIWWESEIHKNKGGESVVAGTSSGNGNIERDGTAESTNDIANKNKKGNSYNHHRKNKPQKEEILDFQFEWIRAHTQQKVIQLAGLALASDFTPRKVAVQLSNDLFR